MNNARGVGSRQAIGERDGDFEDALERCGGNKAEAARLLDMPRSTYYSKLKKYEITP